MNLCYSTTISLDETTNLRTKYFLIAVVLRRPRLLEKLGFLVGQTANPCCFLTKNLDIRAALAEGMKFRQEGLLDCYKKLAREISVMVPSDGSVSIEVYADSNTSVEEMITQARQMNSWIPNAHIQLPIIPSLLEAAVVLVKEGIRANMTLCFSQAQVALSTPPFEVQNQVRFLSPGLSAG